MNTNFNALTAIQHIAKKSEDSELKEENMKLVSTEIADLSQYLGVTKTQAVFFALIFSMNYTDHSVTIEDLAEHFNLNPLDILSRHKDLKELVTKGIIGDKKHARRSLYLADKNFNIPNNIVDAVLNNQAPEIEEETQQRDFLGFLHELDRIFAMRYEEVINTRNLINEAKDLIGNYEHLSEIKNVNKLNLDIKEQLFFFHICMRTVSGYNAITLENITEEIFDNIRERFMFNKKVLRRQGPLFQHDLIKFTNSFFKNKQRIKVTEKGINMMFGEDEDLFLSQEKVDNLIKPEQIQAKSLIYNNQEKEKVCFLQDMLMKEKLKEIQDRLKEKNMPTGVTILLYGSPGTGKTETTKQLARKTGREIIYVDMSQTKSMWFGESEKKVKEIFDQYNSYSQKQNSMPILLFNEADALFSTRKQANHSAVSQTENAIQNILLEHLENFNGILIATTNLILNLDNAFDRRFLYKIKFGEPSWDVRSMIWKSKIKGLSKKNSDILANKYNFSGGQIDNIARKIITEEILYDKDPDINSIISYCDDEILQKGKNSVGFKK